MYKKKRVAWQKRRKNAARIKAKTKAAITAGRSAKPSAPAHHPTKKHK